MSEKQEAGTDLVVLSKGEQAAIAKMEESLLGGAEFTSAADEDSAEISNEIIAQMLAATSIDELERPEAEGLREHLGEPFEIRNVVARPSSYEEGHRLFMVIRAVSLVDGSQIIRTTGSGQVMAQLIALAKMGKVTGTRCVAKTSEKPTKSGFYPIWLSFLPSPETDELEHVEGSVRA